MKKAGFVILCILAGYTTSMMAQETKKPIYLKHTVQYGQNMNMSRTLEKAVSRYGMPV